MALFLPYLFLTFALLAVSFGVGHIISHRFGRLTDEPYANVFITLLIGLSVLVAGYAIICTKGHSILLPVLPFVVAITCSVKRPLGNAEEQKLGGYGSATVLCAAFATCLFIYTIRFLLLYDPASPFLRTPFQDYIFYARTSMPLNEMGIESNSLELIYPQFVGAQPYHYFELWVSALLVKITGLPALWCLYLATYSALISIIALGIRAILAYFRLATTWAWLLTGLLLLVSGICWPFFARYPLTANGQLVASSLLLLEPKLAPVYLFLICSTLLLVYRRFAQAGFALAALPLVYVSTAPAIGGGTIILAFYLWFTRQIPKAQAVRLAWPMVGALIYFGVFYLIQPKAYHLSEPLNNAVNELLPKISEVRTLTNIFIGVLLNYLLYFGAYLVVLLIVAKRKNDLIGQPEIRLLLVWSGLLAVLAAAMRTLATHYGDGYQFSSNVMAPLLPIMLAILLGALFVRASILRRSLATLVLAALCAVNFYPLIAGAHSMHKVTRYSPNFLQHVRAELPKLGNRGAFLLGNSDYENTYMLSQDTYTAGTYVANFTNNYALVSLSALAVDSLTTDPRYARDSVQARQRLHTSSFYRYLRLHPHKTVGRDSLQYQFVTEQNIRFVCVSAHAALPAILQQLVVRSFVDATSGEKFYVLRNTMK